MKTIYIIAVKAKKMPELYQFSTKRDRAGFIKDLEIKAAGPAK